MLMIAKPQPGAGMTMKQFWLWPSTTHYATKDAAAEVAVQAGRDVIDGKIGGQTPEDL
jgi:hypothetical protein